VAAAVTETCKGCGGEVVTMTYRGTGYCCGRCTDSAPPVEPAKGSADLANAVEPVEPYPVHNEPECTVPE
jgi:hypothetical protein